MVDENVIALLLPFFVFCLAYLSYGLVVQLMEFLKARKRQKEAIENICKGPHKWTNMVIDGFNEDKVCEDCGFVADRNIILPMYQVRSVLAARKEYEELLEFKENQIKKLAENYSLSEEITRNIFERGIAVKQDFFVEKMSKALKEKNDLGISEEDNIH